MVACVISKTTRGGLSVDRRISASLRRSRLGRIRHWPVRSGTS